MTDIWAVLTSFASRINIFVDSRLRSHHVCPGNNLSSTDNFFPISENGDCFLNCRSCPNCNWECFYPVNIVLLVFNTGRQFGWIGTVNFRLKYSDKRSWEAKQLFLGFSTSKTRKKNQCTILLDYVMLCMQMILEHLKFNICKKKILSTAFGATSQMQNRIRQSTLFKYVALNLRLHAEHHINPLVNGKSGVRLWRIKRDVYDEDFFNISRSSNVFASYVYYRLDEE